MSCRGSASERSPPEGAPAAVFADRAQAPVEVVVGDGRTGLKVVGERLEGAAAVSEAQHDVAVAFVGALLAVEEIDDFPAQGDVLAGHGRCEARPVHKK